MYRAIQFSNNICGVCVGGGGGVVHMCVGGCMCFWVPFAESLLLFFQCYALGYCCCCVIKDRCDMQRQREHRCVKEIRGVFQRQREQKCISEAKRTEVISEAE